MNIKKNKISERELRKLHNGILQELGRMCCKVQLELVERASLAMLQDLESQYGNAPILKRTDLFDHKGRLTSRGGRYVRQEHKNAFVGDFTIGCKYPVHELKRVLTEKTFRYFEAKRAKEKGVKTPMGRYQNN